MNNSNFNPDNRFEDISLILKDLLKVIKVVSMYPEDNPLPQSLRRSFAEKLESLVEEFGDIQITVEKRSLLLDDNVVFEDRSKEESLAGIFFDTGITKFTFAAGLMVEEIDCFLDVLKEYINSPRQSQDLVNLLWEANLAHFKFITVEDIALAKYDGEIDIKELLSSADDDSGRQLSDEMPDNYDAIFNYRREENSIELDDDSKQPLSSDRRPSSAGPGRRVRRGSGRGRVRDVASIDSVAGDGNQTDASPGHATVFGDDDFDDNSPGIFNAARAMGFGDLGAGSEAQSISVPPPLDTTLILNDECKLSEEDEKHIAELNRVDSEFEMYESTLEILKEMLVQESDMNQFYETVTIAEKVGNEFILSGHLQQASQLLKYIHELDGRLEKDKGLWSQRLKDVLITAGGRERLKSLREALNGNPDIGVAAVREYLNNFGWEALNSITDLMAELEHEKHRDAICDFLAARGRENMPVIARGLSDGRAENARSSVIILARIGDDRSLEYLKKVVSHKDQNVRMELVQAIKNSPHEQTVALLRDLANDPDRDVRRVAVQSISSRRGKPAFDAITEIINDDNFSANDADDQQHLFNAFSILGGDLAVPYLSQLVRKYNLFRNEALTFYRRAAFEALSFNRGEKAEKLLIELSGNWRPDVKNQAKQALYRRRTIIYGGDQ